jgi:hypothetical protein
MSRGRERAIAQAFISLSDNLVDGFDALDLLSGLTVDCARLLGITAVGLLADGRGTLHLAAASSNATRDVELPQLHVQEGPCLECYRTGVPVSVADLSRETQRWPRFVPAALQAGFVAVHAMPMRLQDNVLGALGLFGTANGALQDDDVALAQALAHVASVSLVTGTTAADRAVLIEQLQTALTSRVVLEQAKGLIAQSGDLGMDQAFSLLRAYARNHNVGLTDVARTLVSRQLSTQQVLDHKRTAAIDRTPAARSTG